MTAAEPSAGMRAAFSKALPHVPLLPASAASLPVPDGAYDAVFVGQAFHWFATEGTGQLQQLLQLHELAPRVLPPHGHGPEAFTPTRTFARMPKEAPRTHKHMAPLWSPFPAQPA